MPHARLERAVIDVTGETAEDFLQNLVTSDLDLLGPAEARPSALLTPQGKILFDFLVSRIAGGLRLDAAATVRGDLLKRLTLYRLRAKVALDAPDVAVFAVWDETPSTDQVVDRRFPDGLVSRVYGTAPDDSVSAYPAAFANLRIRAGIAEAGSDFPSADAFPHDVLLDGNGGVSFKKGCFIGQEVVSRMQHRGTARRRIMLVKAEEPLAPGIEIVAEGKPVGTVLASISGNEDGVAAGTGMAMIRIDRLAAALDRGVPVTAGGVPVTATVPPWAGYALPAVSALAAEDEA